MASCATARQRNPFAPSGMYWLLPYNTSIPFPAYCDNDR